MRDVRALGTIDDGSVDETTLTVEGERRQANEARSKHGRLAVVYPFELESEVEVGPQLIIGRRPEAGTPGLPIIHPTVSRQHASITRDAEGVHVIQDLGSHNGSWVDGVSISGASAQLRSGSVVRLGEVLLVYETAAEAHPGETPALLEALPGQSGAMRKLRAEVLRAAASSATALICGETGTGKERVAGEIHRLSGRTGRFAAFNTNEVSQELFASTLFGHEPGAFTGAEASNVGIVRSAEGGTLLLDEIGDLDASKQVALLRLIEERELRPLGRSTPIKVDVRFLAATNRELREEIDAGRFRRDLYARLALVPINMPPLRSRRMDVAAWIARFDALEGARAAFTAEGMEAALLHAWPENLRGVQRLVQAARLRPLGAPAFSRKEVLEVLGDAPSLPVAAAKERAVVEKPPKPPMPTESELAEMMAKLKSVRAVAKHYGRDRRQIYRWLEAYNLPR